MPLTTQGYLDALECAGRIQSADHIIDLAIFRGRNVKKQCNSLQPDIATAIKKQLAKNNDKGRG
jgi:hypothetical protein